MKFHGIDYYFRKKKKMVILNSKINEILPELMDRNLKLADRLKDKLKVSLFFNGIEQRNKQYLQNFIFSSKQRTKDLRTGVKMDKALKHSSEMLSVLCNQMSDDIMIQNIEQLKKEKKLILEKTEEETHSKIDELLNNLRNAIKKPKNTKKELEIKNEKSYTSKDINEVKDYIIDKIKVEEKKTNEKITGYLKKLNYIFQNCDCNNKLNDEVINEEDEEYRKNYLKRKKAINKLSDNFYLKKNIRLINYSKPKPFQLKDREGANLKRIKNCLYPSLIDKLIIQKQEKEDLNQSDTSLQTQTILSNNSDITNQNEKNKNSSISFLKSNIYSSNKDFSKIDDELESINPYGKDTLEILNSLATQGKFLSERFEKKYERANSLIDLNLPYPKNYELLLNYSRIKDQENHNKNYKYFYPLKSKQTLGSRNDGNRTLPILNANLRHKLTFLKADIENRKLNKNMFDSVFRSYIGFDTTKHDMNKNIRINKHINLRKGIKHKASMDNIKLKKSDTVFITLKKMKNGITTCKQRKIRSSDFKKSV